MEYIKLFFKNYKSIFRGLYNTLIFKFLSKENKALILKRREICNGCNFMSENIKKYAPYNSNRIDKHCSLCKCNINLKTACLQCKCGIETYNKEKNQNLKLKW